MAFTLDKSTEAFNEAKEYIQASQQSCSFLSGVGGTPPFIDHASGSYLYDIDGNQYIDYIGSWGPMILGHVHPEVTGALTTIARGLAMVPTTWRHN